MFTLYFMWDFIIRVVCERKCKDSSSHWRPSGFHEKIHEKLSRKVSHVQSTWLECKELWQLVFVNNSQVRPSRKILAKHYVLLFWHIYSTISSPIFHYPHIVRRVFKRENHINYLWELEIVIPTIIYIILCDFPLLLPLHIYILEKLIA